MLDQLALNSSLSNSFAGGHTKTASYRSFLENVEVVGKDEAIKIARLEYNCMVAVHDFIQKHDLDCDSRRCDTVDIFYDEQQWKEAHEAVDQIQKVIGKDDPAARYTFHNTQQTADKFHTPRTFGSLQYEAGSLSAYKFTTSILKLALDKGLNLQTNTPVTHLRMSSQDTSIGLWEVDTPRGIIAARQVLLATNGYTAHLYPRLQGVIVPFRGIITAQRPGQSMPQTGLPLTYSFIYKDGYEYMITRPTGTKFEGDIVIGGGLTKGTSGGDEEYGSTDDTIYDTDIAEYLTNCTKTFFGTQNWGEDHPDGRVRKTWSGIMGYAADGHPLVGAVPGEQNLFIDASFQGHGMVLCFLCAEAVAQIILGKDGKDLDEWFPRSFRVTEERMRQRFGGRLQVSSATDVAQNGHT